MRMQSGFRQDDLAVILGVSRPTYSYYETGKTSPDMITLRKLAAVYSIDPVSFFYPEKFVQPMVEQNRQRVRRRSHPKSETVKDLSREQRRAIAEARLKEALD